MFFFWVAYLIRQCLLMKNLVITSYITRTSQRAEYELIVSLQEAYDERRLTRNAVRPSFYLNWNSLVKLIDGTDAAWKIPTLFNRRHFQMHYHEATSSNILYNPGTYNSVFSMNSVIHNLTFEFHFTQ